MRPHNLFAFFNTLALLLSAIPGSAATEPQAAALWLSHQLHRQIEASQILVSPEASALEGCTIIHARRASTGATALSLRCPTLALPQLVLLHLPVDDAAPGADWKSHDTSHGSARGSMLKAPPIVRVGAALRADWRTDSLHAQLPVVALDSGAAGAEIRVRIANTNHILRARVLDANVVAITVAGA